jgi:hypothetical protein
VVLLTVARVDRRFYAGNLQPVGSGKGELT